MSLASVMHGGRTLERLPLGKKPPLVPVVPIELEDGDSGKGRREHPLERREKCAEGDDDVPFLIPNRYLHFVDSHGLERQDGVGSGGLRVGERRLWKLDVSEAGRRPHVPARAERETPTP